MWIRRMMAALSAALLASLAACGGSGSPLADVNAGPEQNVLVGASVVLSGYLTNSGTATLTSATWQIIDRPTGSSAALGNANALTNASFTADVAGTYRLQLTAELQPNSPGAAKYTKTSLTSVIASTSAPSTPAAPIAHAGPDQSVKVGTLVTLDGSASSDANGDVLKPLWSFSSLPEGSTAALSNPTSLHPSFVPDKVGSYTVVLVVSDGSLSSNSASVTITAVKTNAAPVANAGPAQKVTTGTQVTLDGSASSDADGDPLTARWSLDGRPTGSQASLASHTSFQPSFVADVAGSYTASLIVNDGQLDSAAASVTITAAVANVAPVANAGPAQAVITGTQVMLDGTASTDANGDKLTAQWTLTSKPQGSTALLFAPNTFNPAFVADLEGSYTIALIVNDGQLNSAASTVSITAIAPSPQPPACQVNCAP